MHILLRDGFVVGDISDADKGAYLEHLKDKLISDHIPVIPFPYTSADADWWVAHVADETAKQGRSLNWAIRSPNGQLVGGIGFQGLEVGVTHKAQLGYWLARPFRGRGIMTHAVTRVSALAFAELALVRIFAYVFDFNVASVRVLEKAGFELEGRLRKYYCAKDGTFSDALMYARVNA
jgi:RimJ/RimL family protein N-acetyltransferase